MSSKVAVLAHYQPLDAPRVTHIAQRDADFLVNRMVAERISRKVIRMFPPASVFNAVKVCPQPCRELDAVLAPIELRNIRRHPGKSEVGIDQGRRRLSVAMATLIAKGKHFN